MLHPSEPSIVLGRGFLLSFPGLPACFMTPADGKHRDREVGPRHASEPEPAAATSYPPESGFPPGIKPRCADAPARQCTLSNTTTTTSSSFKLDSYLEFLSGHS